jgi:hypothetical protein
MTLSIESLNNQIDIEREYEKEVIQKLLVKIYDLNNILGITKTIASELTN